MTTSEFITEISKKTNVSRSVVEKVVKTFQRTVEEQLARKRKVTVSGFGTFDISKRKAREGLNPQNGQKIKIPAMNLPHFRPGARLKKIVK